MAALISSVMSTKDKVPFFVSRCEEMGISVLPPDVNASGHDFVVVEGDIRFGLDAVKNVGYAAVEKILEARESGGPFTSIWDFCARVDCTHREQEGDREPRSSAARSTRPARRRKGMLAVLRPGAGVGRRRRRRTRSPARARSSTWVTTAAAAAPVAAAHYPPIPDRGVRPRRAAARCEKETLGIFLSSHPLADVRHLLRARVDCSLAELASKPDGAWVTVGGLITQAKRIRTKSGDPMMFATLDDLDGQVEMLIFNSAYASNESKAASTSA